MPRSSRHKSKRKDAREYSDAEEDVSKGKYREGKDEGWNRGCKESVEKRKLSSQSVVVKDSSVHGNGYSSDEYVGSKKRKGKSDKVGSDRWNGSGEVLYRESETRDESSQFDAKVLKSKGLIDLKSKVGSARRDAEKKEENIGLFFGNEESRSGKVESKRRLEMDISEKEKLDTYINRKDDYQLKDAREDERGSDRDNRLVDSKLNLDCQAVDGEEKKVKKGVESKGWPLEDEYGKHESEKDRERRRKKRTNESDHKDKYQDRNRDSSDINVTSRRERDKDGREIEERHKEMSIRDKHYWASEEVYGKHESEKERETQRRKRTDDSDGKDKYQDRNRDISDINLTSRSERDKDGRDRDERHKDISSRDKNRDYYDRDSKGRDIDKREGTDRESKGRDVDKRDGTDRERTLKTDDFRDDRASRDHIVSKTDSKHVRDETDSLDSRHKKSRTDSSNFDRSAMYEDQGYRYKDYKETRGSMDQEDYGDIRPRSAKEYLESEKKSAGAREETVPDRERSHSFLPEESSLGQSIRKRSPSLTAHTTRDQYRYSKQTETKYRESLPEERSRRNLHNGKEGNGSGVERDHASRAIDKSVQKGDSAHVVDLSSERHRNTDRRVSPVRLADKSLSPSSTERRHLSRTYDRRSLDYEDSGRRNSGYKDTSYHYYDGKRIQDVKVEASSMGGSSQLDGDNVHVSSSRSARTSGNSRSRLPPPSPLKHGVDNSYVGSSEEDGRGKLNNRPKRLVESSMGRMQGNAWWGAPNWPSPMPNGFLPFPHGPAAVGFHPMMQQFPPQMFGARPPIDHSGIPFHISDGDRFPGYGRPFGWPNPVDETCPSPLQNWDSNNMVPGEGYTQGRLDWDQNRSLASNASREPSVDRFKVANSATMESPSGSRRATAELIDDLSSKSYHGLKNEPRQCGPQDDKAGNDNQFGMKLSSDISAPSKENSDRKSNAMVSEEKKKNLDIVDHVHRSCAYLSKIDVSACLAYSDIFDQCVSFLGMKQSTLSDTRMSRFSLEEENDAEGRSTPTNSYISRVPIFAGVGDSLFEKAMSLYRRDSMAANYISSASNENTSPKTRGSEPAPTSLDGRGLLASSQLVGELPASKFMEEKATKPIISPTSDKDVANKAEVRINTSEEVKEEMLAREVSEVDVDVDVDEATAVESTTSNASEAVKEEFENDPSRCSATKGCEDAMMTTELNELESVNLRRIHQSPESTH